MKNYEKYKECNPQETIGKIQQILREVGLFPLLRWTGDPKSRTRSCRFTLYPGDCGANGKGTDELYCMASGLAELMERLQNGMLLYRPRWSKDLPDSCFQVTPDEEELPLSELLSHPDPFTAQILLRLSGEDVLSGGEALCRQLCAASNEVPSMKVVPFVDLKTGETFRVPVHLLRYACGSNGMAAGNTMEEALVQGLSELLEREVNLMILEGKVVPPEIPDEAVEQYNFYPLIRDLRKKEKYRVSLWDCSLGKGWPVAALCVRNLERGTFGIRFGAHPSFPVAVERTLTEAAQGHSMEVFSASCRAGVPEDVLRGQNLLNIAGDGSGLYPASLFTEKPGWSYRPWDRFRSGGNSAFLKILIEMLDAEGHKVLARDTSFLGFPTCHIVIPDFRPIRLINGAGVRLKRSMNLAASSWDHFPALSEAEADRLLRLIRYEEGSVNHNVIKTVSGLPLTSPAYSSDRVGAFLALHLGQFMHAMHFFHKLAETERDSEKRQYYACLWEYCNCRRAGHSPEKSECLVRQFYPDSAADRACRDLSELRQNGLSEAIFPKRNCPDCGACPLDGDGCRYRIETEIFCRAARAMMHRNTV